MREETRNLNGAEKVAVLMLALGEEHGSALWRMLEDEEIREISSVMANMGQINAGIVERVLMDFAGQISSTGSLIGSFESTERLLLRSLPEDRVAMIMEEIRGPAGRTMWDKLGNVNEQVLASYLKNEYPQTVAVVLSKVKSDHAARVLAALPEDFAIEVINRMLKMEAVQKEVLDKVEQTLRVEFMSNLARTARRDAHETIAEIFNGLDRATETKFLTAIEERSRESAERIRALMFTFEDLAKLDPNGIQVLMRAIEKSRLALALKGASETLRDLFFSNMSERAARLLRDEMEQMGPVRLREVEEAQMQMVQSAKDLAAQGQIMLIDSKGEDELIY